MKILINDDYDNREGLIKIFSNSDYERNELIFCSGYDESKNFILQNMENQKCHIDLIVTNNHPGKRDNTLNAEALAMLKNSSPLSYSNGNFRVNSVPIILYSDSEEKTELEHTPFDAIVKKKEGYHHPYFISSIENLIRNWRKELLLDFDRLELKINRQPYFKDSQSKDYYDNRFGKNYESTFHKTAIVSKEFIANPTILEYEWITANESLIEQNINKYHSTYTNHIKYDRYNNERTILHDFFKLYPRILKRDSYIDYLYETQLKDVGETRQACDFILTTNIPSYLVTTFFEIKKEDVKLMVAKRKKRSRLSSEFSGYLGQLWDYKKYSQSLNNKGEMLEKIGYETTNYQYQILAGRLEEKAEMLEVFNERLSDHYPGLDAITFEELEILNINSFKKFNRLKVK